MGAHVKPYLDVPNCTSCNKFIMVMTERVCCSIKAILAGTRKSGTNSSSFSMMKNSSNQHVVLIKPKTCENYHRKKKSINPYVA